MLFTGSSLSGITKPPLNRPSSWRLSSSLVSHPLSEAPNETECFHALQLFSYSSLFCVIKRKRWGSCVSQSPRREQMMCSGRATEDISVRHLLTRQVKGHAGGQRGTLEQQHWGAGTTSRLEVLGRNRRKKWWPHECKRSQHWSLCSEADFPTNLATVIYVIQSRRCWPISRVEPTREKAALLVK